MIGFVSETPKINYYNYYTHNTLGMYCLKFKI